MHDAQMGKIDIKTTIKLSDQDKKNITEDMPWLNESLAHLGVDTNFSKFVRLVARDLHQARENGDEVAWPPRLERAKQKPGAEKRRTKKKS